jgi:hypothetical protein
MKPCIKPAVLTSVAALLVIGEASCQDLASLDQELRKTWPNNRTVNVVFHGHSVPSGYHLTPQVKPFESYPHLFRVMLSERYPTAVINVITTSIGGENSLAGAARFQADVLSRKPDLVFIDYALNDRPQVLADVETAWRSMVDAAQAANVPVVLMTPTGATNADLSNPSDPLTERAALIRTIASSEGVLLADVSADWLATIQGGTPQGDLLSQANHPNLAGHQLAANRLFTTFSAATGAVTTEAAGMPRDGSVNTFTTSDAKLTLSTTNTFQGQGDFVGDSGGTANRVNAFDGTETLQMALAADARLNGFALRYTEATITITGFLSDPGVRIGTVNNLPGTSSWNDPAKTLTIGIPWDNNRRRHVIFTNADASKGQTLTLSFSNNGAMVHQATFTDFTHQIDLP